MFGFKKFKLKIYFFRKILYIIDNYKKLFLICRTCCFFLNLLRCVKSHHLRCMENNFKMIDLYYWGTPNGHKIAIALEEMGLDYQIFPINILSWLASSIKGKKCAPSLCPSWFQKPSKDKIPLSAYKLTCL